MVNREKTIIAVIIISILMALVAKNTFERAYMHYRIANLRESDVSELSIGNTTVTDSGTIKRVLVELQSSRAFSPSHTSLGRDIPLNIRLSNGKKLEYELCRILGTDAVLIHSSDHVYLRYSDEIGSELKRLSVDLP